VNYLKEKGEQKKDKKNSPGKEPGGLGRGESRVLDPFNNPGGEAFESIGGFLLEKRRKWLRQ